MQVNYTSFSWKQASASLVTLLCSVALGILGCVVHNGATVKSHGVVTQDYLCQVEEHLNVYLEANRKTVSFTLSSELRPGCQEDSKQFGGGGLDPTCLLSDVLLGLKRRVQGVSPA